MAYRVTINLYDFNITDIVRTRNFLEFFPRVGGRVQNMSAPHIRTRLSPPTRLKSFALSARFIVSCTGVDTSIIAPPRVTVINALPPFGRKNGALVTKFRSRNRTLAASLDFRCGRHITIRSRPNR